jgi:hypothetical protein
LIIKRSTSYNHHNTYTPEKAHDGDYETWYSVKDGAVAGNFLKLYLSRGYRIGEVRMISRPGDYTTRMVNTEIRVYSTETGETEVASCGKITGKLR